MGHSVLDFPEECPHDIMNYFDKNTTGAFIVPHPKHDMNDRLLARFIGKIAIEFLAYRVFSVPGWQHEAVFKKEIDSLRGFVRFDRLNGKWDLSVRPIYSPIQTFTRETGEVDQVLNELDLLYIDFKYLFLIVCIFGVEYAIGMNGPSMLPIYMDWLQDNNNVSPLYSERKF